MRNLRERLPKERNIVVTVRDDRQKLNLFELLRRLHKEASLFVREQEGYKRIKIQLKISVR